MPVKTDCPHCGHGNKHKVELWQMAQATPVTVTCDSCDTYYVIRCSLSVDAEVYVLAEPKN